VKNKLLLSLSDTNLTIYLLALYSIEGFRFRGLSTFVFDVLSHEELEGIVLSYWITSKSFSSSIFLLITLYKKSLLSVTVKKALMI
jgi:hypothetical protein